MQKFTIRNIDSLPVVAEDDHQELIGMLNRREVIAFYNEQLAKRKAGTHADHDQQAEDESSGFDSSSKRE